MSDKGRDIIFEDFIQPPRWATPPGHEVEHFLELNFLLDVFEVEKFPKVPQGVKLTSITGRLVMVVYYDVRSDSVQVEVLEDSRCFNGSI